MPYLVGTDTLRRRGAVNLLLSHNPGVFPIAAQQGWDLTVAGHTHGGQGGSYWVKEVSRSCGPEKK